MNAAETARVHDIAKALEQIALGAPVDCSESEFSHNPDFGLAGDCCTYTFLREVSK